MKTSGALVLADGTIFEGISVGVAGHICGEVVFNTSQTGYQEILTDPSYTEQVIVFTQPHIGNVGVNALDMESNQVFAAGAVMRSFSAIASNWRSEETLSSFFHKHNVIALSEIDTRALTHHLRNLGSQSGCLMAGEVDLDKALDYAKRFPGLLGKDLAKSVTTEKSYAWNKGSWFEKMAKNKLLDERLANKKDSYRIVVLDFGVKHSILRQLIDYGCKVTVVPAATSFKDILALKPHGIVLSNGPGDPAACEYAITTIKKLLEHGMPIMAICLGHQLLALASGATTEKMVFGHHGANHPVVSGADGTVSISSQNHGFVVSEENLPQCLRITHRSLFDGTIAGIERTDVPAFGFQGHPEAGPGPTELTELFNRFVNLLEGFYAKKN